MATNYYPYMLHYLLEIHKCLFRVPCLMEPPNLIKTYVIGTSVVLLCLVDPLINFVVVVPIAFLVEVAMNYYN